MLCVLGKDQACRAGGWGDWDGQEKRRGKDGRLPPWPWVQALLRGARVPSLAFSCSGPHGEGPAECLVNRATSPAVRHLSPPQVEAIPTHRVPQAGHLSLGPQESEKGKARGHRGPSASPSPLRRCMRKRPGDGAGRVQPCPGTEVPVGTAQLRRVTGQPGSSSPHPWPLKLPRGVAWSLSPTPGRGRRAAPLWEAPVAQAPPKPTQPPTAWG